MNLRSLLLVVVALGFGQIAEAQPTGWSTNVTAAWSEATNRQQPVLMYFTAKWCGPCKLMARTTFTNQAITQTWGSIIRVTVDIDDQPKVAEQHGIRAVPAFHLFSPGGEAVAKTTGYQTADQFVAWLTNALQQASAADAQQKLTAAKLDVVDQLLQAADEPSLRKATTELLELCAQHRGPLPSEVRQRLDQLATKSPSTLLAGLNHPSLAVRILVANTLHAKLGDTFNIDPWADAETRRAAGASWQARDRVVKP
ncbi:MAG TPA: thioredoxin family protein [Verrucomicrobiae bacterium]|nr:thioredoxin family protein [Verrucomicrobiae bacterium]